MSFITRFWTRDPDDTTPTSSPRSLTVGPPLSPGFTGFCVSRIMAEIDWPVWMRKVSWWRPRTVPAENRQNAPPSSRPTPDAPTEYTAAPVAAGRSASGRPATPVGNFSSSSTARSRRLSRASTVAFTASRRALVA